MNRLARAQLMGPWQPETILPSQLGGQGRARCAELDLVAAILEDAVQCVRRNATAQHRRERRQFDEACSWLWDDTHEWPFAFVNICGVLGLDPAAIREELREFIERRDGAEISGNRQPSDQSTGNSRWSPAGPRHGAAERAAERERFEIVGWDEV